MYNNIDSRVAKFDLVLLVNSVRSNVLCFFFKKTPLSSSHINAGIFKYIEQVKAVS